MPITKSAIRKARQDIRRRKHNLGYRRQLKKAVKLLRESATTATKEDLNKQLRSAFKVLDKAAKRKLIHKNKAARLKSKLSKLTSSRNEKLNPSSPAPAPTESA